MINIKYLHCLLLSIGAIIFWWPMGRINVLSFPFFSCSTSWYYLHLWCLLLFVLFCIIWSLSLYNIVVVFTIHWHESAMGVHESPILNCPPASLPIPSLGVVPVHWLWVPVSCTKLGLVIYFTYGDIHGSMLFSQIIPPSSSARESKSMFFISVSLLLSCI